MSAHALANSLIVVVTVLSFILAVVIGYLIAQSITFLSGMQWMFRAVFPRAISPWILLSRRRTKQVS